ncbi:MAG: hydroxymethylbilane synthase [Desulfovibrio sp.]|jgi:hydroxymethylbilane synthase|nr:hydroxymethylbilane synthase [Desulfovibrio sp.]
MQRLVIAARGSRLALRQAEHVRDLLAQAHGFDCAIIALKTRGDLVTDAPLHRIGGKGLFVKEIEEALLDGRADIAVHSMKDLPADLPTGLVLGAVPARETPFDMLLSARLPGLDALPAGARVGTGSLRRGAQLKSLRPDLEIALLRGNVDTRLKKLLQGDFDAVVMAAAGLRRLGLEAPFAELLAPPRFLPAPGQGALALECRADREDVREALAALHDAEAADCVTAERAFMAGLDAGCRAPVAAVAVLRGGNRTDAVLSLEGLIADPEGLRVVRGEISGPRGEAHRLGAELAAQVACAGGADILRELFHAEQQEGTIL